MTMTAGSSRNLFYRLNVISLQLPPLRDRREDIPLLAGHFLQKYGEENRKGDLEMTPSALDLLTECDWPGNVGELENVIERAVVLTAGPRIGAELIPEHVRKAGEFDVRISSFRQKHFVQGRDQRLREAADRIDARGGWRVQKRAAELLHVKPTTLNEMNQAARHQAAA